MRLSFTCVSSGQVILHQLNEYYETFESHFLWKSNCVAVKRTQVLPENEGGEVDQLVFLFFLVESKSSELKQLRIAVSRDAMIIAHQDRITIFDPALNNTSLYSVESALIDVKKELDYSKQLKQKVFGMFGFIENC